MAALTEECALLGAQQQLAFAVALFASGSRLKRRGVEVSSCWGSSGVQLLSRGRQGLAAVLSAEGSPYELYVVLAGDRDRPLAPPDTVIGMVPTLAPLDVAERAAAEGGWAWQVAQVRAEVARLQAELGL